MTTPELRERLADLAEESHVYADPDAALAGARRLHRRRLIGQLGAVAVAVTLTGGIAALAPDAGRERPVPPSDSPTEARLIYPPTVGVSPDPPYLPSKTPTGPAAFFFAPCPQLSGACWPRLVMPDGRQFRLPMTIDSGMPRDLSLSPDGRYAAWGYQVDGWIYVVDLATGNTRHVGEGQFGQRTSPVAWSPETRWLLLAERDGGTVRRYQLVDLRAGVRELPASVIGPGESVIGVTDAGELVVRMAGPDRQLPDIRVVDPTSRTEVSRVRTSVPAHLSWRLGPDDRVTGAWLNPCSCTVMLVVDAPLLQVLVHVDLRDGHVISATPLDYAVASSASDPGTWTVGGSPAGTVLLVHRHPEGVDIVQLTKLDTRNGERRVLTRMPAGTRVVVRGPGVTPIGEPVTAGR